VELRKGRLPNPVVITGAAAITALGHTVSETWQALLAGKQAVRPIEGFSTDGFACKLAAQIQGLDCSEFDNDSRSARIMDLPSYMLLKCALAVFHEAGWDEAQIPPEDIGLFTGMGAVDLRVDDLLSAVLSSVDEAGKFDNDRFWSRGYREIYPLISLFMSNNISPCQAAIRMAIRGENAVFSSHAGAGAQAIVEAMKTLREGRAQAVITGGVSEKVSLFSLARAHLDGVLNLENQSGNGDRVDSATYRGGVHLGEGAGFLALESHRTALARGTSALAMITGCGSAFEPEPKSAAPSPAAIAEAMRLALQSAELSPTDIDIILLHRDGAPAGDRNEATAVEKVFGSQLSKVVTYSTKSALGHLLAAAPVVDTIVASQILKNGLVPSTCSPHGSSKEDDFSGPIEVSSRRVLVNCRSWEGHCDSLIVEAVI
jgi:3-oxoacyl-[acyl-carrier-protein] synthase II